MGVGRVEVSGQEDGIEGSLIAAESNSRRGDRETRQFASNLGSKQSSGMKGGRLLAQVLEVLNFPTSERRGSGGGLSVAGSCFGTASFFVNAAAVLWGVFHRDYPSHAP